MKSLAHSVDVTGVIVVGVVAALRAAGGSVSGCIRNRALVHFAQTFVGIMAHFSTLMTLHSGFIKAWASFIVEGSSVVLKGCYHEG